MDLLRVKSEVIAGHKAQQHVVGMSASGYLWLSLDCVLDRAQAQLESDITSSSLLRCATPCNLTVRRATHSTCIVRSSSNGHTHPHGYTPECTSLACTYFAPLAGQWATQIISLPRARGHEERTVSQLVEPLRKRACERQRSGCIGLTRAARPRCLSPLITRRSRQRPPTRGARFLPACPG